MRAEKIICIYKITSPANKIYIGQSSDFENRIRKYVLFGCKNQRKLFNSIKKHGWDNHKIEILHQLSEYNNEELNNLEIYYGNLFDCRNPQTGLNLKELGSDRGKHSEESKKLIGLASLGNKHMLGTKQSDETKKKRSDSMKGHPFWGKGKHTEETKRKMSDKGKGRKWSKESRDRLSKAKTGSKMSAEAIEKGRLKRIGKKHSDEHKRKISESNKGKKMSPEAYAKLMIRLNSTEHKQKTSKTHLGKIVSNETKEKLSRVILNTQNGIYYIGVQSAADSLNLNRGTLVNKLNNRTTNNTLFIYA